MLFLVELLQVQQGIFVLRIEPQDLVERFEGAIDEAASLVVETEAQEDVRVLQPSQARALKKRLVDGDGLADLSLFAVQVPQDHVDVERVRIDARGAKQFLDCQVGLIGDQEVQPDEIARIGARRRSIHFPPRSL